MSKHRPLFTPNVEKKAEPETGGLEYDEAPEKVAEVAVQESPKVETVEVVPTPSEPVVAPPIVAPAPTSATSSFDLAASAPVHPLVTPSATVQGNQFTPVHGFVTVCKGCGKQVTHRTNNASRVPGRCIDCGAPLLLAGEVA